MILRGTKTFHKFGFPDDESPARPTANTYTSVQQLPTIVHDPSGDFRPDAEFRAVDINCMLNQRVLSIGTTIRIDDDIYTVKMHTWTLRYKRNKKWVSRLSSRLTLFDCHGREWQGRREYIMLGEKGNRHE